MAVAYLDYQPNMMALAAQIRPLLQPTPEAGICVIRHFPIETDHGALLALTHQLGEPLLEAHNINGGAVCAVQVDHGGRPAYANTPHVFPCHTDCADFEQPPDVVLLLCEKQAQAGGESYWIPLKDVLPQLTSAQIEQLSQPLFPFRTNLYPILAPWGIRYNRLMIDLYWRLYQWGTPELVALMNALDEVLAQHRQVFSLQVGDCLLLNNHHLLHGRGAFDENSDRLLKRVRFHLRGC